MTTEPSGLGLTGVFTNLDRLSANDAIAYVQTAERLGYGAFWLNETFGREPFAFIGALARATSTIHLGLAIAVIYARGPFTAHAGALTLAELANGRFVMGLGVSNPVTVETIRGRKFEAPVPTLRAYAAAYRSATYKGSSTSPPPLLFAALGDAMVRLAASDADGAFAYLVSAQRVREMRALLDASTTEGAKRPLLAVAVAVRVDRQLERAHSAARAYLAPYLTTPTYRESLLRQGFTDTQLEAPLSASVIDPLVICGSSEQVRQRLRELHTSGADHVAILPLRADGGRADEETLEALRPPW